ncbi:potassium channel-like protein [Setomelanomma holmii]|uniref:Potassium channel-like protein n=1 Tax=Setomelanomma holmii TaxID=210430 RepID=A0A9P4HIM3_9PLEO|nr:potassium channel-like protein [Setomelanomma holmii]
MTTSNPDAPEREAEKPAAERAVQKKKGRFAAYLEEEKRWWRVFKKWKEGDGNDWWFASTAIPLLAATLGPLANVSSIAALVTSWRQSNYVDEVWLSDFDGVPYADPKWCYWLNVASLICGFLGNLFLLLNFTQRIRYIVALPVTIILWYLSSGFLIGITACMNIYTPPNHTQGFWYAIAAAAFYTICSMLLMINMLGHFLGHYPESFDLSDSQRTLILQTMAFFIWLGGGSAVFMKLENDAGADGWGYPDALYFCDVTILTVGFGDLVPTTNVARGIVFPFSVGGIITLALIVSSLYKFVREIGEDKIISKHINRLRERTLKRTLSPSFDLRRLEHSEHRLIRKRSMESHPKISTPTNPRPMRTTLGNVGNTVRRAASMSLSIVPDALKIKREPQITLTNEKTRFDAMRQIQADTKKFKKWMALFWSVTTFSILWCVGAVVFWQAEKDTQGMSYFQALYFCYISLLTIGYGDLAPKSNAGRCFFVIWSLIAVPTMTILVSDLGDTVVDKFKKWSDELADFTVLPKEGIWRAILEKHPWLLNWLQRRIESHQTKKRLRKGFDTMDPSSADSAGHPLSSADPENPPHPDLDTDLELTQHPTIPELAQDISKPPTQASLSRRLALSIKKVSLDFRLDRPRRYTYEEWVEFTRLIRFTTPERLDRDLGTSTEVENETEGGWVNWDWIGDDSPMMSTMTESEWLIERLCESLVRLERRKEVACDKRNLEAMRDMEVRDATDDTRREISSGGSGGSSSRSGDRSMSGGGEKARRLPEGA